MGWPLNNRLLSDLMQDLCQERGMYFMSISRPIDQYFINFHFTAVEEVNEPKVMNGPCRTIVIPEYLDIT